MKRVLLALVFCAGVSMAQTAAAVIFEFHNGFWLNLHQFLCAQAAASSPVESDSPEWRASVEYYKHEIVPKGQLDDEPAAINNRLSAAGSSDELPVTGLNAELVSTLVKAAPVYRRTWWTEHNRANRAWIEAVEPLIAKYGARMSKDIAAVFQVDWPAAPIRVDVSAYAGPLGAYTTVEPTVHITVSSTDAGYQGAAGFEMLFHETSHALDERVRSALQRELSTRDRLFRRREFSHAIIFYTTGEIARRYLPGYEPYAIRNGIWEKGWPGGLEVLEKDWKPYLDHTIDLTSAVQAIVRDYGVSKGAH